MAASLLSAFGGSLRFTKMTVFVWSQMATPLSPGHLLVVARDSAKSFADGNYIGPLMHLLSNASLVGMREQGIFVRKGQSMLLHQRIHRQSCTWPFASTKGF